MTRLLLLLPVLIPAIALAAPSDVPSDAWFAGTVSAFMDAGYLPGDEDFRPADAATRAEFIDLIVQLQGGVSSQPTAQSFDDVSINMSYYPAFEEAARQGWIKGTENCYGTHPCYASPQDPINRAEASAILLRAFALDATDDAPSFEDIPPTAWYADSIGAAASLCILRGDGGTHRVRPADHMNRAEMLVMLDRLLRRLRYPACDAPGVPYALPSAPEPYASPLQPATAQSSPQGDLCSQEAWDCLSFGNCTTVNEEKVVGFEVRLCKIIDATCREPDRVKPPLEDCALEVEDALAAMESQLSYGRLLAEKMHEEVKSLKLSTTTANSISNMHNRYVEFHNEYAGIYEDTLAALEAYGYHRAEDEPFADQQPLKLFAGAEVYDTPKPLGLIERITQIPKPSIMTIGW